MNDKEKPKYLQKNNNKQDEIVFTTKTAGKVKMADWQLTLKAIANLIAQNKSLTNGNLVIEKNKLEK